MASRMGPRVQKYPGGSTSTLLMRRARAWEIRLGMRWQRGRALLPGSIACQVSRRCRPRQLAIARE
eukprot:485688-Pyramimonas_sp.AAC.1